MNLGRLAKQAKTVPSTSAAAWPGLKADAIELKNIAKSKGSADPQGRRGRRGGRGSRRARRGAEGAAEPRHLNEHAMRRRR